ncbi:unnamed protein product, partial [Symbiodinium sp. CCMP2456]
MTIAEEVSLTLPNANTERETVEVTSKVMELSLVLDCVTTSAELSTRSEFGVPKGDVRRSPYKKMEAGGAVTVANVSDLTEPIAFQLAAGEAVPGDQCAFFDPVSQTWSTQGMGNVDAETFTALLSRTMNGTWCLTTHTSMFALVQIIPFESMWDPEAGTLNANGYILAGAFVGLVVCLMLCFACGLLVRRMRPAAAGQTEIQDPGRLWVVTFSRSQVMAETKTVVSDEDDEHEETMDAKQKVHIRWDVDPAPLLTKLNHLKGHRWVSMDLRAKRVTGVAGSVTKEASQSYAKRSFRNMLQGVEGEDGMTKKTTDAAAQMGRQASVTSEAFLGAVESNQDSGVAREDSEIYEVSLRGAASDFGLVEVSVDPSPGTWEPSSAWQEMYQDAQLVHYYSHTHGRTLLGFIQGSGQFMGTDADELPRYNCAIGVRRQLRRMVPLTDLRPPFRGGDPVMVFLEDERTWHPGAIAATPALALHHAAKFQVSVLDMDASGAVLRGPRPGVCFATERVERCLRLVPSDSAGYGVASRRATESGPTEAATAAADRAAMARHAVLLLACAAWSTLAEKCDDFRCPSGSEPRQGEEGRTSEECCQRLCSSFNCPSHSGFVSINNVSAAGLTTASCCRKLPSCTENSRYVPLSSPSLDEGRAEVAASSIECAERCQASTGCVGFTWLSDSSCHLAGANATLRFMPGGVSGNTTCHSLRPCTGKVHQLFAQASPQILSSGSSSQLDLAGVAVVDWDADGRLDVVTSHGSGRLGLFLQGSDGKFSASTDNPFRSIEVGESAKPTIFDWDGDGELDVLVGNADGDLKFLKGSGDGAVAMTWNWYPFSTLTTLGRTAPAMADLTDDGHPDLVLGHGCQLDVYLGQGNHSLALTASHDFASSGSSGSCAVVPTVWDWDGDGMKEVIVGDQAGKFHLCRLINGTTLTCDSLEGYGVGEMASPSACDWDSDGVPDLIVQSRGLQDLAWFRRGPRPDVLEVPAKKEPALFGFDVGESAVPVLVDWDLDGDLDLIVGSADGRLWFFPQENGEFVSSNHPDGPFASVDVGSNCAPTAVDWDSDGFPDLILGSGQGRLTLLRGGSAEPLLEGQRLFASVDLKTRVQPAVVDWDSDGDLDLLLLAGGRIQYFRNEHGRFVQVPDEYSPFSQVGDVLRRQGLSTDDSLCLQAIDADSDGDWDLVVGGLLLEQLSDGTLKYLTGSDSAFPSQWPWPADGPPCLAYGDLDMDGVLDLVVGFRDGRLDLGLGKLGDDFKAQEGLANPVGDLGLGMARKTPGIVDWDGDGKGDLLVSADGMRLFLHEADGSLKETTTKLASLEGRSPLSIVTVDWTMDGDDDILLIEKQALVLLERSGSEGFLPAFEVFHWSLRDGLPTVTGGTVADWDEDGLFDVLVGLESGRLQHWRQRASGQMQLVPEDESPFAGIVGEGSAQPAMADVNGDGKPDLILGSSGRLQIYLQDEEGKLIRRHVLDGFRGDVVPVAADWDGDGESEIILGTSSNDLVYLDQGPCAPRDACLGQSGLCNSKSQVCECLPGHSGIDCSKCATGFSSTPRNSERGHDCYPCPGNSGACSHRGVCVDDHYVQAAAVGRREISDPRLLRGNGSCVCHPNYFGKDCVQGECPAGQEPAADLASGWSTQLAS